MEFTRNQKKAYDLNRHISVTAGAGSGKTSVLVHRYLKILLETDLHPSQVVAITFTEKAAAELKQRIVNEVNARLQAEPHNTRLEQIKAGMLYAQISTIHAFCSQILREYPVEARVDAGFSVLQGIHQRLTLRDTIDSTLREIAERPDEDETREKLVKLLRIFGKTRLGEYLEELINQREVMDRLINHLYCQTDSEMLEGWHDFVQSQLVESLTDLYPLEDWLCCLNSVLEIARGRNAAEVRELVADIQPNMKPRAAVSRLREIAPFLRTQDGTISKRDFLGIRVETDGIKKEIDFLVRAANYFESFPTFTDDDELLICVTRLLLAIYDEVQNAYAERKRQTGQLDFADLQIKVRDLLQQESIREQLAQRYPYIMVDEYQDTDHLQYEIIKPLISDFKSGNLFIVGDQNQGIYRFRGADVKVFDQTRQEITDYQSTLTEAFTWEGQILEADNSEKRGELYLPENFRLLRNLVGFVNLVFGALMKGQNEFEIKYEPLIQGRAADQHGDVELLLCSKEEKESKLESSVDENDLIVKRIRRLVGTDEKVWKDEGDGETLQSIRYGDIAILIRSRTRLPMIESALLNAEIPYKITGGIGFYQRQEIYDINNYLQFLINPANDVALAGVLRAPFFGVSDVKLYEIAQQSPTEQKTFWEKVQDYVGHTDQSSICRIDYAVQILRTHLEICHHIPPSELIRKIVNDTGMVGVLSVGPGGEQRWANYEKLLGIARDSERSGFLDLSDLLEQLDLMIEEEEREAQATTQLTADAVEIMTIHAAKGLEFPVVILPNLDQNPTRSDQEPFIDDSLGIGFKFANPGENYKESDPGATQLMRARAKNKREAEEQRLFYVAATRARDRLILSGTLTEKGEAKQWLYWLFDALEISEMPSESELLRPMTIQALSGQEATTTTFDLPIRIIKSLDEFHVDQEKVATPSPPTEFPAVEIEPLIPSPVNKTFSVAELTTYAHCPTRFYLHYQIHVPPLDSQTEETGEIASTDVNRFLDAKVREIVLNADEVYRKRHIYAEIGSHIIDGIADRFFKDSRGLWQVINYEMDRIDWGEIGVPVDYYRAQIELYALLVYRLYPEQHIIPVTIYSTDLNTPYSVELTKEELVELERAWLEQLKTVKAAVNSDVAGAGSFKKNRAHCPLCPYFADGECMLPD